MKLNLQGGLALIASAICVIAGCGEGPLKTVPVSGLISFADRQPPPQCDVIFQPIKVDGPLRPSFADRQPDGTYQVKAFKKSKGLIPGTYRVLVVCHDLKPGANPKLETSWILTNHDGGEVNVDAKSGGVEHNIEIKGAGKKG